jgi:hypothetical protein
MNSALSLHKGLFGNRKFAMLGMDSGAIPFYNS